MSRVQLHANRLDIASICIRSMFRKYNSSECVDRESAISTVLMTVWGAENAGVENAGAITRGNPLEEIP